MAGVGLGFKIRETIVQNFTLPLTGCLILGKSYYLRLRKMLCLQVTAQCPSLVSAQAILDVRNECRQLWAEVMTWNSEARGVIKMDRNQLYHLRQEQQIVDLQGPI